MTPKQARDWMIDRLEFDPEEVVDRDGNVNLTALAERCAHAYDNDSALDDPDHFVWEIAIEAAESSAWDLA